MNEEKVELIEETDLNLFELSEGDDENNLIKDELLGILQNKVSELGQENNLLRSNLGYLGAVKERYIVLLDLTRNALTEISNLKAGQGQSVAKLQEELSQSEIKFETLRENHVNLSSKVETGYKPRINDLEKKVEMLTAKNSNGTEK